MPEISPEATILNEYRHVAMVGASPNPERYGYMVNNSISPVVQRKKWTHKGD